MNIFKNKIHFTDQDPLANGLDEEIRAEQKEQDSFTLDDASGEDLISQWNAIIKDVEKDPDWFSFSNE